MGAGLVSKEDAEGTARQSLCLKGSLVLRRFDLNEKGTPTEADASHDPL